MGNTSKDALRRRDAEPAQRLNGRPKREWFQGAIAHGYCTPLEKKPGVKHHPNVTTNGHSERDNPSVAL